MTIVLFTLSQYLNLTYYHDRHTLSDNIVDTVFFSPEIHISQFLIGMIGGYLFNRIKHTISKYRFLPLVLFVAIFMAVAFRPEDLSYQVGLLDPLFMLLIISIAISNPRALNVRPLVYLGEISYGIYILQWPVYFWLDSLNTKHFHMPTSWLFYIALGALLLVASVSYYLMELPLKRKISAARK